MKQTLHEALTLQIEAYFDQTLSLENRIELASEANNYRAANEISIELIVLERIIKDLKRLL